MLKQIPSSYVRPVTRVIQVKMTEALLTTSTKNSQMGGFDKEWDDSIWD